jgi:uncharacterized protein (TIGR02246 family)
MNPRHPNIRHPKSDDDVTSDTTTMTSPFAIISNGGGAQRRHSKTKICGYPIVHVILGIITCWSMIMYYKQSVSCEESGYASPLSIMEIKETNTTASSLATKEDIRNLFNLWNDAVLTGNSQIVAQLYAKDATLLPTLSNKARNTPESIRDYFDKFLLKKPAGKILDDGEEPSLSSIQILSSTCAQDNGTYQFTMGIDGSVVKARYTFIYQKQPDGIWKIIHHHSSLMPE